MNNEFFPLLTSSYILIIRILHVCYKLYIFVVRCFCNYLNNVTMNNQFSAMSSLRRFLKLNTNGSIQYPRGILQFKMENKHSYYSFRHYKASLKGAELPVVLKVEYQLPSWRKFHITKLLTKMSIPFYCGIPSLREKYRCIDISWYGYMERYEFASHAVSEALMKSLLMRNSERRARPGSL